MLQQGNPGGQPAWWPLARTRGNGGQTAQIPRSASPQGKGLRFPRTAVVEGETGKRSFFLLSASWLFEPPPGPISELLKGVREPVSEGGQNEDNGGPPGAPPRPALRWRGPPREAGVSSVFLQFAPGQILP